METAKIILQAWEEFRSLSPEEKKLRREKLEQRIKDIEEDEEDDEDEEKENTL